MGEVPGALQRVLLVSAIIFVELFGCTLDVIRQTYKRDPLRPPLLSSFYDDFSVAKLLILRKVLIKDFIRLILLNWPTLSKR